MPETTLDFLLRIKKSGTGAKEAQSEFGDLQKQAVSLQGAVSSLAGGAGVGLLISGLKYSVEQAMQAQQVMAQTEAVIKSTGGAAGLSADQISGLAGDLSQLSGVEDETIQSGENLLLTFKEIKGTTFERATQDMLDMAVAMNQGSLQGIDLKGTAIQMGKALNVAAGDTAGATRALSALARVGVSFSTSQKEAAKSAIELGDTEKFQSIILTELESEFGGAAKAAGDTAAGAFGKLQVSVGNLAEKIGGALLPTLTEAADAANQLITWNEKQTQTLTEHEAEVRKTAKTYGDYVAEMGRAELAAGKLSEADARELQALRDGLPIQSQYAGGVDVIIEKAGLASEAEFNLAHMTDTRREAIEEALPAMALLKQATDDTALSDDDLKAAQAALKEEIGGLNALINGQLGPEMVSFRDKTIDLRDRGDELKAKIAELEGKSWLTADQKQELADTREELGKNNAAIVENANQHDLATKKILFNLIEQRVQSALTAGQISQEDFTKIQTALNQQAVSWGLIDQATADATTGIDTAIGDLINGGSVDGFVKTMDQIAGPTKDSNAAAMADYAKQYADTGTAVQTGLTDKVDTANDTLGTKQPAAINNAEGALNEYRGLLEKQMQPGDVIDRYLIGLSKIEAAYKNIAAAAKATPGLPASGGASVGVGIDGMRAEGGPVEQGKMYIVGEHGPEPFIAPSDGFILPNSSLNSSPTQIGSRAGGVNIYLTYVEGPLSMGDRVKFETEVVPMLKAALA